MRFRIKGVSGNWKHRCYQLLNVTDSEDPCKCTHLALQYKLREKLSEAEDCNAEDRIWSPRVLKPCNLRARAVQELKTSAKLDLVNWPIVS